MNWTQTTTCALEILFYKCEWPNHLFLYRSLLPFCTKGCTCILKWVMPGLHLQIDNSTLQNDSNTKHLSSLGWLVLVCWVKEPCLRDSHATQCFPAVLCTPSTPKVSPAQSDSTQLPVKVCHQLDQTCSPAIPEGLGRCTALPVMKLCSLIGETDS